MKLDLASYFPIPPGGLREDCIVNRNMDLTAGFNLALPRIFSLGESGLDDFHGGLVNIIKRLPSGTVLHFQDVRYSEKFQKKYDGTSAAQKENFRRFYDRGVLKGGTNLYVTFSNKTLRKINGMQSFLMRAVNYTAGNPFQDLQKVVDQYRQFVKPFESDLKLSGLLDAERLNSEQLRACIGDYFGLRYSEPLSPEDAKDFIIPDYEITDGYLRIGGEFVAVLSFTREGPQVMSSIKSIDLPRSVTGIFSPQTSRLPVSMIYPLTIGLPFDHITNVGIEVIDNDVAKSIINTAKYSNNILSSFMQEAKDKNDESAAFLETISRHHYQACRTSVNVIINDSSLSVLEEKVGYAKKMAANMNDSSMWYENKDAANLFFGSGPGCMKTNYRNFLQTVDQAVSYVPKEQLYASDPHGVYMVSPHGEPVVVNVMDPPGTDNGNAVLFGPSGTGKSVVLNYLIDQFVATKCKVYVVDVGASYNRNCKANGGLYLDSRESKNFSFNPFLCRQDSRGNYLFEGAAGEDDLLIKNYVVNNVYSNLSAIVSNPEIMTANVAAVVRKSIRSFYGHVNEKGLLPCMREYFQFTRHFESELLEEEYREFVDFNQLRLMLEPFAFGPHKDLLNSERNEFNTDYSLTVAELKAVVENKELREIVFLNILNNILRIVEKGDFHYFYAILDEVMDYLKGDFGDSIGGFFRKIRKDGGRVIVATQGIKYLNDINPFVKESILSNCDIKILTNHNKYKESAFPALRKDLSLTDLDFEILESLERDSSSREVFFKFGQEPRKYRIELSPFAYGLYNTTKKDLNVIYEYMEKFGSQNAAIAQFIEDKFKKENN